MTRISAYTILYKDLQFYEDIIQNIYDYIDELVIIDGPYSYAVDVLKKFNLFYDAKNKPDCLEYLINKYPKIKYTYSVYESEEEKRIVGYNLCSSDIVLLVDTDEFININFEMLSAFISDNSKYVCGADIYNMCDNNVHFDDLTQKYILFKKEKISALEHLDYTWLVGCKQNKKNISYISKYKFGSIYHFTLNRNKQNNIIKFIFYVLLHRKISNQPYNLFDQYNNDYLIKYLSVDEILNIFIHAQEQRINIPKNVSNLRLLETNSELKKLEKYNKNLLDYNFRNKMKCMVNIPVFIRVEKDKSEYILKSNNIMNLNIEINYLYFGATPNKRLLSYSNIDDDVIKIPNEIKRPDLKYVYIKLECSKTKNYDKIFTLENLD